MLTKLIKVEDDSPQVKVPPPLGVVFVLVSGIALNHFYPSPMIADATSKWLVGGLVFAVGVGLMLWSALLFKTHQTNIEPWRETLVLLDRGPYRFSRNPIYLSFLIVAAGLLFWVNNTFSWLLLLPLFIFLNFYVIRREEAYLISKFGEQYLEFKRSTRRWL